MARTVYPKCLNCKNFAWWDGDYCCVYQAKILNYSNEECGFTEPIPVNACEDFRRIEKCDRRTHDWYKRMYKKAMEGGFGNG